MQLGIYRHYKGKEYRVIGTARHTETEEEVVMYQALYGDYGFWVRPKTMFEGSLDLEGKTVKRFTFISE